MSSTDLIQSAGFLAILFALLLTLLVALLRLAALPLAGAVLVLDAAAAVAARPLTLPAPVHKEARP